jgi:hypothetical protein
MATAKGGGGGAVKAKKGAAKGNKPAAGGVAKKKANGGADGGAPKTKATTPVMDIAPLKAQNSEDEDPFMELEPSSSGGENSAVVYIGCAPPHRPPFLSVLPPLPKRRHAAQRAASLAGSH